MSPVNKLWTRKTVPLQLAALLCAAPVLAQTTAPSAQPAAVQQMPTVKAAETVLPAGAAMSADDPRLARKVTVSLDNVTVYTALARLSAASGVSLLADGEQLQSKKISAAFVAKPMRDVLDALASLGDYQWVGRKSGTFVLRAIPHTAVDPKIDKWGQDIRGLVGRMTPDQQQALSKPYGTSLNDLSPDMQAAVLGTLAALPDPVGPDGKPIPFYEDLLNNRANLVVGFQVEHQEDGNDYYLSCALPGHSSTVNRIGHG